MERNNLTEAGLLSSLARLTSIVGDGVEKAQITTGPGSSQGNMTDMHQEEFGDSWSDGISGDGTDYNGRGRKANKARGRGDTYDEEKQEESEEEEDDEKKALPTAGAPLRTSAPNANETIEPGAPGMTKKSNEFGVGERQEHGLPGATGRGTRTPGGKPPAASPEENLARQSPTKTRALRQQQMRRQTPLTRSLEESDESADKSHGMEHRETPVTVSGDAPAEPPTARSQFQNRVNTPRERRQQSAGRQAGRATGEAAQDVKKNVGLRPSVGAGTSMGMRRSIEIEEDGEVQKGIEVSEFLFYLNKAFGDAVYDVGQRVERRIQLHHGARGEFASGLAEAVVGINKSLGMYEDNLVEEETAPAHAAKSVQGSNEGQRGLQKSLRQGVDLRKAILDELGEQLQKGNGDVRPIDVIRVETSPGLEGLTPSLSNIPAVRQLLNQSS